MEGQTGSFSSNIKLDPNASESLVQIPDLSHQDIFNFEKIMSAWHFENPVVLAGKQLEQPDNTLGGEAGAYPCRSGGCESPLEGVLIDSQVDSGHLPSSVCVGMCALCVRRLFSVQISVLVLSY